MLYAILLLKFNGLEIKEKLTDLSPVPLEGYNLRSQCLNGSIKILNSLMALDVLDGIVIVLGSVKVTEYPPKKVV